LRRYLSLKNRELQQDRKGAQVNIESVKRKYEEQVMQLPNVTGIGIGKKGRKDVIKVFVTQKLPESALQSYEIIPKTLEGYETDVDEIGVVTAQA
jgi:hypothetical protein